MPVPRSFSIYSQISEAVQQQKYVKGFQSRSHAYPFIKECRDPDHT
jgi:hypothetical protein